jgi:hypothetical protein
MGESDVCLVVPQSQANVSSRNPPVLPHQCTKMILKLKSQNDPLLVFNLVKMYMNLFSQADGQGVILLVYSVILTRGCK